MFYFHPEDWGNDGNDPIWRAYVSDGGLNHQLDRYCMFVILLMQEILLTSWGWWFIPLFTGFQKHRWWLAGYTARPPSPHRDIHHGYQLRSELHLAGNIRRRAWIAECEFLHIHASLFLRGMPAKPSPAHTIPNFNGADRDKTWFLPSWTSRSCNGLVNPLLHRSLRLKTRRSINSIMMILGQKMRSKEKT